MRELPIPSETLTPKPTIVTMPVLHFIQTLAPTFTDELERIITPKRFVSPFKNKLILGRSMVRRFQLETATPGGSSGPNTRQDLAPSGSGPASEGGSGGSETPTTTAQIVRPLTWFATKQTHEGNAPAFIKRLILTPTKGSSSKRPKK